MTHLYQSGGVPRYRCEVCDYDLCDQCFLCEINEQEDRPELMSSTKQARMVGYVFNSFISNREEINIIIYLIINIIVSIKQIHTLT